MLEKEINRLIQAAQYCFPRALLKQKSSIEIINHNIDSEAERRGDLQDYSTRFNNKAMILHALEDMVVVTAFVDGVTNEKALQSFPMKIQTSMNEVNDRI